MGVIRTDALFIPFPSIINYWTQKGTIPIVVIIAHHIIIIVVVIVIVIVIVVVVVLLFHHIPFFGVRTGMIIIICRRKLMITVYWCTINNYCDAYPLLPKQKTHYCDHPCCATKYFLSLYRVIQDLFPPHTPPSTSTSIVEYNW